MTLRLISILLLPLLLLTTRPEIAASQMRNPSGELLLSQPDDILPQTMQESEFNEFWNYQIYLDNGVKLHIIFSVNNFGSFRAPVSGVRVTAFGLTEETYNLTREYDLDWLVLDEENYTFRNRNERDLYFTGKLPEEHRVVIHTTKSGIEYDIDLQFSDIHPGYKWGDATYHLNDDFVGIVTHIPYANVTGRVVIDGNGGAVTGTGYMDQTWQTRSVTRLVHSGYHMVHHGGPDNWDILYFLLRSDRDERYTVGHRLSRSGGETRINGVTQITEKTKSRAFGKQLAQNLSIQLNDGRTMSINRSRDDETYSLLSELPWVARRAARSFLGGEVVDFRGEVYCRIEGELPKTGEYNYFIID